jgi:lipopolysaccharide export system protein LptA
MKQLFLISAITFIIGATNSSSAQKHEAPLSSIIQSDRVSVDAKSKVSILEGNVAITFGKLDVLNADKVTIDKMANKVIVVGYKEFSFKGKLIVLPSIDSKQTTIEYTLGDEVAYIK